MRWGQGRAAIDGMLSRGELERVPPSREHADLLLTQAHQHLKSAEAVMAIDPTGAYQLLYDAARKALGSLLENQGPRATSRGGHIERSPVVKPDAGDQAERDRAGARS